MRAAFILFLFVLLPLLPVSAEEAFTLPSSGAVRVTGSVVGVSHTGELTLRYGSTDEDVVRVSPGKGAHNAAKACRAGDQITVKGTIRKSRGGGHTIRAEEITPVEKASGGNEL